MINSVIDHTDPKVVYLGKDESPTVLLQYRYVYHNGNRYAYLALTS